MKDLETRKDIELLVNSFYSKVKIDPTIGYIFTEVVNVDWEEHLPKMYSFWETIIFGSTSFKGNPIRTHKELSWKTKMGEEQFDRWLALWTQTIDEKFKGIRADEIKQRGKNIAGLMLFKIQQLER
ncbi:group III truncated hemoglobin [Rasiella sp. SM2506]|uniref:group III truncated hemoglobin n=1 Tax=Rasiella sp. SM2506 TaxID=3423914 RepID=UPI003D7B3092